MVTSPRFSENRVVLTLRQCCGAQPPLKYASNALHKTCFTRTFAYKMFYFNVGTFFGKFETKRATQNERENSKTLIHVSI